MKVWTPKRWQNRHSLGSLEASRLGSASSSWWAGVVVNLILGFLIYSMVLFVWGRRAPSDTETTVLAAFQTASWWHTVSKMGDRILSIPDGSAQYFNEIGGDILINKARQIEFERGGENFDHHLARYHSGGFDERRSASAFLPHLPTGCGRS